MKRAVIVYQSRTGTTQQLAEEIGTFLATRGIDPTVASVDGFDPQTLGEVDFLLLGCWTDGLMVVLQHPDERWVAFARRLPVLANARVGLFTTYKVATGTMFAKMREPLAGRIAAPGLELRSRTGHLSDPDRWAIDRFIAGA